MRSFMLSLVAGAVVLGCMAFTPSAAEAGRVVRRPVIRVIRPVPNRGYYYYWYSWVRR